MSFADIIDIEDWGANPYGDPGANACVINMALSQGSPVVIPSKPFPIAGKISVVNRGQELFGVGKAALVQCSPNTDGVVLEQAALAEVKLRNFSVIAQTGVDFSEGGVGIKSQYCGNSRIEGINIVRMHRGLYIDTRTFVDTADLYLDDCHAYDTVEDGFILNNCCQTYVSRSSSKSCGGNGLRIVDGSAVHLDHFLSLINVLNGVKVMTDDQPTTDWHFFDQVECDGNGADGYRIFNTKGLQVSNSWAGTSGGVGWNFMSGNSQAALSNVTARNNKAHGLYANGLVHSAISNIVANWNGETSESGSGVTIDGASYGVVLSNPMLTEMNSPKHQRYGIRVCGTSSDVQVLGGAARGNLVCAVDKTTSGTVRINNLLGYN